MNIFANRRRTLAAVGVFLAVALVASGIWLLIGRGGGGTTAPPAGPPSAGPSAEPSAGPSASPTPVMMTVTVYFHKGQGGDPRTVVPVTRSVPRTPMMATAALTQLLAGPTGAERDAGYWSHFSAATAVMLRSVRIGNGVAHADFHDFSRIIPNASTSAGSAALVAELDTTLRQFSTVQTTVYSFNGDVAAFYEWLQMVPPVGTPSSPAEARAVARTFLTEVVGVRNPSDEAFRWVGSGLAEVDFHSQIRSEAGVSRGPLTTVSLSRDARSWSVIGARTDTIRVDSPGQLQAISSPVTVVGRALAWEGHVTVRVVQTSGVQVTELGRGYVTGGGDILRPFSGQIPFGKPSAARGWVILISASGYNGEAAAATVRQVTFAAVPAPPQVLDFRTTPVLRTAPGRCPRPPCSARPREPAMGSRSPALPQRAPSRAFQCVDHRSERVDGCFPFNVYHP